MVELLWKATTGIINQRTTAGITYHNIFHGFRMRRGMGNVILEDKLIHQMKTTREEVLHTVLLDLQKAYNTPDHDRCLIILAGYNVVPWTLRLLWMYWTWLRIVENAG